MNTLKRKILDFLIYNYDSVYTSQMVYDELLKLDPQMEFHLSSVRGTLSNLVKERSVRSKRFLQMRVFFF